MNDSTRDKFLFDTFRPTAEQVEKLIAASSNHSLGVEFLLKGDLGAVAATFAVHAFTVEAAREYILKEK